MGCIARSVLAPSRVGKAVYTAKPNKISTPGYLQDPNRRLSWACKLRFRPGARAGILSGPGRCFRTNQSLAPRWYQQRKGVLPSYLCGLHERGAKMEPIVRVTSFLVMLICIMLWLRAGAEVR